MQREWKERFTSRKFISAVVYAVVVLLAEGFGYEIAYELYYAVGTILGIYIITEGAIDVKGALDVKGTFDVKDEEDE